MRLDCCKPLQQSISAMLCYSFFPSFSLNFFLILLRPFVSFFSFCLISLYNKLTILRTTVYQQLLTEKFLCFFAVVCCFNSLVNLGLWHIRSTFILQPKSQLGEELQFREKRIKFQRNSAAAAVVMQCNKQMQYKMHDSLLVIQHECMQMLKPSCPVYLSIEQSMFGNSRLRIKPH